MDFWQTVLVLFRRWYITVPAFFATLGLAAVAYSMVPAQYESGSILLLTTPLSGGTESTQPDSHVSATNPFTNFDPSLGLTGSVIIQQLRSPEAAASLGVSKDAGYVINNGSSNPERLEEGPFIFVTGMGTTPAAAHDMTERISAMAAALLKERQAELGAPASTYVELQVVVPPTAGRPLEGSPRRAAAGAGGLAALLSLAAVFGFESLMTHRRRRRIDPGASLDDVDTASQTRPGTDLVTVKSSRLVSASSRSEG